VCRDELIQDILYGLPQVLIEETERTILYLLLVL